MALALLFVSLAIYLLYRLLEVYTLHPVAILVGLLLVVILGLIRIIGLSIIFPGNLKFFQTNFVNSENVRLISCVQK